MFATNAQACTKPPQGKNAKLLRPLDLIGMRIEYMSDRHDAVHRFNIYIYISVIEFFLMISDERVGDCLY